MIDNGLRGVAYREAGHAVVALALGLQLLASKFAMRIIREQPTSQVQIVSRWWTGLQFVLRV